MKNAEAISAIEEEVKDKKETGRFTREAKQKLGQKVIRAGFFRRDSDAVEMGDFTNNTPGSKFTTYDIQRDKDLVDKLRVEYAQNTLESDLTLTEQAKMHDLASSWEKFLVDGINKAHLFGEHIGEDGAPFRVAARATSEYDDYKNGLDVYATIAFAKSDDGEKTGSEVEKLVLGFDATTSHSYATIAKKFLTNYAAGGNLGVSKLKYYEDNTVFPPIRSMKNNVLRYVVGTGIDDMRQMRRSLKQYLADTKSFEKMKDLVGKKILTNFKILSEMNAENEFYMSAIKEGIATDGEKELLSRLRATESVIKPALAECMGIIAEREFIPRSILKIAELPKGDEQKDPEYDNHKIEDYLIATDESGTYAQIMTCCRKLTIDARKGRLGRVAQSVTGMKR